VADRIVDMRCVFSVRAVASGVGVIIKCCAGIVSVRAIVGMRDLCTVDPVGRSV
jgi:hypothetical protein